MKAINVDLQNCHGIRELSSSIPFSTGNATAVYAPNGTMKTSFARTFQDLAAGRETRDRMFPNRESKRSITDEQGDELESDDVVVVLSYDEDLGPTESTSTLLVNPDLRQEYETLQMELLVARDDLVAALKAQSGTRQDIVDEISRVFMRQSDAFFDALVRIEYEVEQLEDLSLGDIPYDVLFNPKVAEILRSDDLQSELAEYVTRLNELLDESVFFSRNTFSFYNAANVTKSLGDNGYFSANHSLLLHSEDGDRPVSNQEDLNALIAEEKLKITDDEDLREKLNVLEKALQKNAETRKFFDLIASREALLPALSNVDALQQDLWKTYLKSSEEMFQKVVTRFKDTEVRRKEIEQQAASESTQWEEVIRIFNDRFFVPFELIAENKHQVMLGQEGMLRLAFRFEEGGETADVERNELLAVLSNGEKKAFYILNVLFEMETRKAADHETLFVVDDLADSFDYKNKYAIIQYLKEMSEHSSFKLVLLTHNFDFFRTLVARGVVTYSNCFMAQKSDQSIVLRQAEHVHNPFIRAFKTNFHSNGMQRIASIPFVRNILEYTKNTSAEDYVKLTSLLHWKEDSGSITNADLDRIFAETFQGQEALSWDPADSAVLDLLSEQAELVLLAAEGVNFEHKIVLSIAIRILAEKYMVGLIDDVEFVNSISSNQTQRLYREVQGRSLGTQCARETLDRVVLMTPENIHLNSFMYEPIIDMSDAALRELYTEVKQL